MATVPLRHRSHPQELGGVGEVLREELVELIRGDELADTTAPRPVLLARLGLHLDRPEHPHGFLARILSAGRLDLHGSCRSSSDGATATRPSRHLPTQNARLEDLQDPLHSFDVLRQHGMYLH